MIVEKYKDFKDSDIYVELIMRYNNIHYLLNKHLYYFIFNSQDKTYYVLKDFDTNGIVYTHNKKIWFHYYKKDLSKVYDLTLCHYLQTNKVIEFKNSIVYNQSIHKFSDNKIIPLTILIQPFQTWLHQIKHIKEFDSTFHYYNTKTLYTMYRMEQKGIVLKDNKTIYSDYNLYTKTGRISNTSMGYNLCALKKNSIEREVIVSNKDKLFKIDFEAFHLQIIAKLIKFKVTENLHLHLGKQYFDKEELTEEEYKKTKELNFKYLFGGIPEELNEIEYFRRTNEYIDKIWKEVNKNGYIESVITKRKIFKQENKNTFFNYLLQLMEQEICIYILDKLYSDFLQDSKDSLLLYVYDEIVFDINTDSEEKIKTYFKDFRFKTKEGKNYNELF